MVVLFLLCFRVPAFSLKVAQTAASNHLCEIKGKCVAFTGFLFYDSIHADEAENTAPGRKKNWRKTAWEVHPVTSYEVLDDDECP